MVSIVSQVSTLSFGSMEQLWVVIPNVDDPVIKWLQAVMKMYPDNGIARVQLNFSGELKILPNGRVVTATEVINNSTKVGVNERDSRYKDMDIAVPKNYPYEQDVHTRPIYRNADGTWPEIPNGLKITGVKEDVSTNQAWKSTVTPIVLNNPQEALVLSFGTTLYQLLKLNGRIPKTIKLLWQYSQAGLQFLEDYKYFLSIGDPPYTDEEYAASAKNLIDKLKTYRALG